MLLAASSQPSDDFVATILAMVGNEDENAALVGELCCATSFARFFNSVVAALSSDLCGGQTRLPNTLGLDQMLKRLRPNSTAVLAQNATASAPQHTSSPSRLLP